MRRRHAIIFAGVLTVLAALALSAFVFRTDYAVPGFVVSAGTVLIFFASFEARDVREVSAERLVLVAVLSALSAAGRVLFVSIPNGQPSSFLIILTGAVFGPETGFLVGAVTALTSNLILGQGPWTPWQMFAWGLMGASSGLLRKPLAKSRAFRVAHGFLWGILYGVILNSWFVLAGFANPVLTEGTLLPFGIAGPLAAYIAALPLDLIHGGVNALLIAALWDRFARLLGRAALKASAYHRDG
jgi:energy-coupling factor transport system substrate-specific component